MDFDISPRQSQFLDRVVGVMQARVESAIPR